MSLPRIGITLGDPGGIGPEIVIRSLSNLSLLPEAHYTIYGSSSVLEAEEKALGIKLDRTKISVREVRSLPTAVKKGAADKDNGAASFLYFKEGVEAARAGEIKAIVTAPSPSFLGAWGELLGGGTQNISSNSIPKPS